jgi:hypothetical protein
MLNFSLSQYNMANLLPTSTPHYVEAQGHGTPDSNSLSMTPDPFSPFQRFHPQMATSEFPLNVSLGYHPRNIRSIASQEISGGQNGVNNSALANEVSVSRDVFRKRMSAGMSCID